MASSLITIGFTGSCLRPPHGSFASASSRFPVTPKKKSAARAWVGAATGSVILLTAVRDEAVVGAGGKKAQTPTHKQNRRRTQHGTLGRHAHIHTWGKGSGQRGVTTAGLSTSANTKKQRAKALLSGGTPKKHTSTAAQTPSATTGVGASACTCTTTRAR